MRSNSVMALVASATLAIADNTVVFWTLDEASRTITCTGNQGQPSIPPVTTYGGGNVTVSFPPGWVGNCYGTVAGQPNEPGMLAEFQFQGWAGKTYYDVSAIVAPNDQNNVHQMFPIGLNGPMSGCKAWPCNNAYWHPDDEQTKVTDATNLVCTLGRGDTGIAFPEEQQQ